ncbi:cation:proton antiporter domain-containing protein [Desertibaculum subflavum]|uniref:cation:proton antiporter domain-containing protein n=1 Tax=Desertibaculum subflavum TaxID=2268458 RepID=UPI000E66A62E
MQHTEALPYLREAIVFLAVAGIVVPLFHRLRVSSVLGFLLVGVVIGPHGLARVAGEDGLLRHIVFADAELVRPLAELGVVLLLFVIGLELPLKRLWTMRVQVFGLGGAQIVVTGIAIAIGAKLFIVADLAAAVVLGAAFALSSTAIVSQLLIESRRLGTSLGRSVFAVLLMQDLAVVPILLLIGAAVAGEEAVSWLAVALAFGKAALAVAAISLAGALLVGPLFRLVGALRNREMFMAASLLVVIAAATATGAAGLSMALGAFLGGVILAESEYRHAVDVEIEPFKGLLLGLFFLSVGMGIDPAATAAQAGTIAALLVGLLALKAGIAAALCRIFGLPGAAAIEAGLLLGQAGEFGFIVVGAAAQGALFDATTAQLIYAVAGLSMLLTPLQAVAARRLVARIEADGAERAAADGLGSLGRVEGHVIVAGFGRVGVTVARLLDAEAVPYVALDLNADAIGAHRRDALPVFYGDASRTAILRLAGAERAQALVITLDEAAAVARCLQAARREWPALPIYARARDLKHARELMDLGATEIVPEAVEASLQLGGRVLAGLGIGEAVVGQRLEFERERLTLIRPPKPPDGDA